MAYIIYHIHLVLKNLVPKKNHIKIICTRFPLLHPFFLFYFILKIISSTYFCFFWASSQAHTSEYKIQKDYTSMHQAIALPHGHGGKMPSIMFSPLKTVTWSSNSNNMIHFLRCQEVSVNSQYNKCSCSLDFNTSRMIIQAFPKKFQYLLAQKKKKYIYIYIFITLFTAVEVTYCDLCTLKTVSSVDSCEGDAIPITTYHLSKL